MGKISTAEVLRLRATSAVSRDQSVRRFAQDDDSVEFGEKHPKQVSAYGTDPDFLCSLVEPRSLVRLSVKKAAYADLSGAACRKSGVVLGEPGPHVNADPSQPD